MNSISDFLENGIDDYTNSLYNYTAHDEEGEEVDGMEEEDLDEGEEDNEGMTASDDEELEQRRHRAQELR